MSGRIDEYLSIKAKDQVILLSIKSAYARDLSLYGSSLKPSLPIDPRTAHSVPTADFSAEMEDDRNRGVLAVKIHGKKVNYFVLINVLVSAGIIIIDKSKNPFLSKPGRLLQFNEEGFLFLFVEGTLYTNKFFENCDYDQCLVHGDTLCQFAVEDIDKEALKKAARDTRKKIDLENENKQLRTTVENLDRMNEAFKYDLDVRKGVLESMEKEHERIMKFLRENEQHAEKKIAGLEAKLKSLQDWTRSIIGVINDIITDASVSNIKAELIDFLCNLEEGIHEKLPPEDNKKA